MSVMFTSNNENNGVSGTGTLCEGPSPGRCSPEQQRGPGRHQATAKRKWPRELNRVVMECYFLSNPVDENGKPIRGYRQRMHRAWKEKGMFEIKEQNLCDQARMIRKNEWLSAIEIEMIKRYVLEDHSEINEENITDEENRVTEGDRENVLPEIGERVAPLFNIEGKSEEQREMMQEIVDIMRSEEREFIPGFKRIERKRLKQVAAKINEVVEDIQTDSITETNNLLNAISMYCARQVSLKKPSEKRRKTNEPWWKRRLNSSINEVRKHLNILERKQKGEYVKKGKHLEIERKYKVKHKGINCVVEELKQRLQAKVFKLKRYEQRIDQFRINRLFQQEQKKVYQEFNGEKKGDNAVPDSEESKKFWSNIWSKNEDHNSEAEWLKELKSEKGQYQQENIVITEGMVKQSCQKLPNWKAPGPDGVQGYWFKKITNLHRRIATQMNSMINNGVRIPEWMTKGRTVLCQKDPTKGNEVGNFRPISCLPLMWKLLTSVLADSIYSYLEENELLPTEQKGCRRKSRGTKDQLLIDKTILRDCKKKNKNLAMAWVDYKKAYDMVPHSWIVESMKLVNISKNIIDFLTRSSETWKTELTACGEALGEIDINRGIFQGDSLSPLLFVLCMIPLSNVLKKMTPGYTLGTAKINHLFFMDDLKLFSKNEKEINSLVSTVHSVSKDIKMEFGIQKCGVLVMKGGKVIKTQGINLGDSTVIKDIDENGYRYLGIMESNYIHEKRMKEQFRKEYLRRTRLVLQSKLNGRNKISAINTWAVSLMRYGAGIINWRKDELKEIDRRTRKLMTMNKALNPNSDVARLYVKRKDGGRGLISIEDCVKEEENNLAWYVQNSNEEMLQIVKLHGHLKIDESKEPKTFKKDNREKTKSDWQDKKMHGQFVRDNNEADWKRTWGWLNKGDLKATTEALVCSAQEQSLRTNYIKHNIDKTADSPLCRMCTQKGETISHIVSECTKLAQREYKRRHDNVARYVHWKLSEKVNLERGKEWYNHKPEACVENDEYKILWDMMIQCDQHIQARKPDLVFMNKRKKELKIIDIAIPGDMRVREKELEKIEKYQPLKDELARLWGLKKIKVIPVVIGALGVVSKKFEKYMTECDSNIRLEVMQKTTLLGTARILRKVLSTEGE